MSPSSVLVSGLSRVGSRFAAFSHRRKKKEENTQWVPLIFFRFSFFFVVNQNFFLLLVLLQTETAGVIESPLSFRVVAVASFQIARTTFFLDGLNEAAYEKSRDELAKDPEKFLINQEQIQPPGQIEPLCQVNYIDDPFFHQKGLKYSAYNTGVYTTAPGDVEKDPKYDDTNSNIDDTSYTNAMLRDVGGIGRKMGLYLRLEEIHELKNNLKARMISVIENSYLLDSITVPGIWSGLPVNLLRFHEGRLIPKFDVTVTYDHYTEEFEARLSVNSLPTTLWVDWAHDNILAHRITCADALHLNTHIYDAKLRGLFPIPEWDESRTLMTPLSGDLGAEARIHETRLSNWMLKIFNEGVLSRQRFCQFDLMRRQPLYPEIQYSEDLKNLITGTGDIIHLNGSLSNHIYYPSNFDEAIMSALFKRPNSLRVWLWRTETDSSYIATSDGYGLSLKYWLRFKHEIRITITEHSASDNMSESDDDEELQYFSFETEKSNSKRKFTIKSDEMSRWEKDVIPPIYTGPSFQSHLKVLRWLNELRETNSRRLPIKRSLYGSFSVRGDGLARKRRKFN